MQAVHGVPGDRIILMTLAAGLFAYGIWRLVQGVLDVDRHGHGPRALVIRGALCLSAETQGALAWGCLQIAMYSPAGNNHPIQHAVARALQWSWGRARDGRVGRAPRSYIRWFQSSSDAFRWLVRSAGLV